eukprot:2406554-Rhodomonas_salina.2
MPVASQCGRRHLNPPPLLPAWRHEIKESRSTGSGANESPPLRYQLDSRRFCLVASPQARPSFPLSILTSAILRQALSPSPRLCSVLCASLRPWPKQDSCSTPSGPSSRTLPQGPQVREHASLNLNLARSDPMCCGFSESPSSSLSLFLLVNLLSPFFFLFTPPFEPSSLQLSLSYPSHLSAPTLGTWKAGNDFAVTARPKARRHHLPDSSATGKAVARVGPKLIWYKFY